MKLCCVPFRKGPSARKFSELEKYYTVDWRVEIGRGGFSTVHRGIEKHTDKQVAVKRIPRQGQSSNRVLKQEINASMKVEGHPNIVSLYDVFVAADVVILCLEYMEGDILFKRIVTSGPLLEEDAKRYFRKIASALDHLHKNKIVHRDLKPENLIFSSKDKDAELKLTDFGLSKILPDGANTMQTFCGTPAYLAPEAWAAETGAMYGPKVDTWSFGVTLYVCLSGYHPFDPKGGGSLQTLRDNILKIRWGFEDPCWENISEDAKDLLRKLICPVEFRLSASEILQHQWMTANDTLAKRLSQMKINNNGNKTYANKARANVTGKRPRTLPESAAVVNAATVIENELRPSKQQRSESLATA